MKPNSKPTGSALPTLDLDAKLAERVFPCPLAPLSLREIAHLLDQRESHPAPREGSFESALQARSKAMTKAVQVAATPILAIMGTMNSGKSTSAATFLSPAGAKRVLIGSNEKHGTHRFVFWLPASWQDNGLGTLMTDQIEERVGMAPEFLSTQTEEADAQYNNIYAFNTPLVAFDPALDHANIAILDCPDIQRPLANDSEPSAHLRLQKLELLTPLASAFLVVASQEQLGTQKVGQLFQTIDSMAVETPLFFCINKAEEDDLAELRKDAETIVRRWKVQDRVKKIYYAPYVRAQNGSVSPQIRSLDEQRVPLARLTAGLDAGQLQKCKLLSDQKQLQALVAEIRSTVNSQTESERDKAASAQSMLIEILQESLIDQDGNPKAIIYNRVLKELHDSAIRTAPVGIKATYKLKEGMETVLQKSKSVLQIVKKKFGEKTKEEIEEKSLFDANVFIHAMRYRTFLPEGTDDKKLRLIWDQAIAEVAKYGDKKIFDEKELDQTTRVLWKRIPKKDRRKVFLRVALLGSVMLGGALLVPFDGGATFVVSTKFGMVLSGAEIIAVLVGAPLGAMLANIPAASALIETLRSKLVAPQIDVLYNTLADGLGIPRETVTPVVLRAQGREVHRIDTSRKETVNPVIQVVSQPIIELNERAWSAVTGHIEA